MASKAERLRRSMHTALSQNEDIAELSILAEDDAQCFAIIAAVLDAMVGAVVGSHDIGPSCMDAIKQAFHLGRVAERELSAADDTTERGE